MSTSPYYQVQVQHGKLSDLTATERKFKQTPLEEARQKALEFAFEQQEEHKEISDNPTLVKETPALIPMLVSFSVDVSLVINENETYQIYGENIHDTLSGLSEEAVYYSRQGLIDESKLVEVLQNTDENDAEDRAYEMPGFLEKGKESKYVSVKVLPYQFSNIIRRTVPV